MPLVKIDYVVSFSSEDPEHPASNLLSPDVKSKWLCNKGEPSCSIVLQLKNACKIDSITIGAYHVALIEVLVGLSEKPNDPFEVLVPSCVLLAPGASRRGDAVESVRSFGAAQLAGAAARRWDRVRLVCAQPYNKHCKYGLAFVHISGPDSPPTPASAPVSAPACAPASAPLRLLPLDTEAGSSDDEFRPGELFARHQRNELNRQSTDAQIRQASSQALKNIADASTKLIKTPISKTSNVRRSRCDERKLDRTRGSLLYADDDGRPRADVGRVDRSNEADAGKVRSVTDDESHKARDRDDNETPQKTDIAPASENATASHKKRKRSEEKYPDLGPVCSSLSEVLPGVVVAMSGYVNPRRAALRTAALQMGAQYVRDWRPDCTHLICAFPNTPKLKSVRAARAPTLAVRGEWLEQCARRRRRLPWRWFATEPQQREPAPARFERELPGAPSDEDTDDEIEKVLKQQGKKQRRSPSAERAADPGDRPDGRSRSTRADDAPPSRRTSNADADDAPAGRRTSNADADASLGLDASGASDVAFVCDERLRAHVTLHSDSDSDADATDADTTDEDERAPHPDSVHITKELPPLWAGRTFVLSRALAGERAARLARYVRAYGGLVLQECEVLHGAGAHFVVGDAGGGGGAACAGARRVRPDWVWRQHRRSDRWPDIGDDTT